MGTRVPHTIWFKEGRIHMTRGSICQRGSVRHKIDNLWTTVQQGSSLPRS